MAAPLLKIWVHPRKTIRPFLDHHPQKWIIWFALIQGLLSGIGWIGFLWTRYPDRPIYSHPGFVGAALVSGALFSIIYLYLGGWLLKITGGWIGGLGTFIEVKCAVGWSYYPYIISSIINIISYFFIFHPWLAVTIGSLNVIIVIWAFILALHLLGAAHRFSAWKALAAILIAFVLVFMVLIIISLLIPLVMPLFARS